jgi:hypothetical protein
MGVGQRAQQQAGRNAEQGRVGANPEREGYDGGESEPGTLAKRARGVTEESHRRPYHPPVRVRAGPRQYSTLTLLNRKRSVLRQATPCI